MKHQEGWVEPMVLPILSAEQEEVLRERISNCPLNLEQLQAIVSEYTPLYTYNGLRFATREYDGKIAIWHIHEVFQGGFRASKGYLQELYPTRSVNSLWLGLKRLHGDKDQWQARRNERIFKAQILKLLDPEIVKLLISGNALTVEHYNAVITNRMARKLLENRKWLSFQAFVEMLGGNTGLDDTLFVLSKLVPNLWNYPIPQYSLRLKRGALKTFINLVASSFTGQEPLTIKRAVRSCSDVTKHNLSRELSPVLRWKAGERQLHVFGCGSNSVPESPYKHLRNLLRRDFKENLPIFMAGYCSYHQLLNGKTVRETYKILRPSIHILLSEMAVFLMGGEKAYRRAVVENGHLSIREFRDLYHHPIGEVETFSLEYIRIPTDPLVREWVKNKKAQLLTTRTVHGYTQVLFSRLDEIQPEDLVTLGGDPNPHINVDTAFENAARRARERDHGQFWNSSIPVIEDLPEGVTHINTYAGIVEEGEKMYHCVGNFAKLSMGGGYLVFHLEHSDEVATLGIWIENQIYKFDQCYGPGNKSVSKPMHSLAMKVLGILEGEQSM